MAARRRPWPLNPSPRHDAVITPETIIPAWYGERPNLDYAIYTRFANAKYHEEARQRGKQPQAA